MSASILKDALKNATDWRIAQISHFCDNDFTSLKDFVHYIPILTRLGNLGDSAVGDAGAVHEPPSEQLVRQLTELQLCLPRDLHRARGRVRRLSFDLPAFDSVWIDSLVQLRLLTPYQARQLEQGHGDGLRIGSLVAIDELGSSPRGSTYLARRLHRRDRCVVKRQTIHSDRSVATRRQMSQLLEKLGGFVHPQLVVPHEIMPSNDSELVMVSRFVPGLPLNELLVRRGRFPATVVFEIGRQLLEGLAALHAKSLVHGDIRMSNIRLTDSGLAVLVNGAIRPVLHPCVTIHDGLSLDAYDGLAPELIGTGAPPTASSEMYSLGCVLWQLLTGRPPFVSADPLAKIAAHQTQSIEDVRAWAPDTPAVLAESIRQLTSSSPQSRPRSFDEILQHWGRPGSFSRSRLRQFRRLFNGAVPHFSKATQPQGISGWVWVTAALVGIASGVALLSDKGMRSELLSVGKSVGTVFQTSHSQLFQTQADPEIATSQADSADRISGLLPLPAPNSDGVILLTEQRPYEASTIAITDRLTIRGLTSAEIRIGKMPLSLSAKEVTLERLVVTRTIDDPLLATVTVRAEHLDVSNCEFSGLEMKTEPAVDGEAASRSGTAAIAWMLPNARGSQTGAISIQNSVFRGDGVSVLLAQTPQTLRINNTLKTGTSSLVVLGPKCHGTDFKIDLDRVTLRDSGPLLNLPGEITANAESEPISVNASNCVFKLSATNAALIVINSDSSRKDLAKLVQMKALESVVEPGTTLLAVYDRERNRLQELEADEQFDGLIASEIKFDGAVASIQGPRTSDAARPGIDPLLLGPKAHQ